MKIFNAQQIRQADKATIERQGISSLQLMDRAANEVFLWLKGKFPERDTVFDIYCGQGNNGGDGLVIGRLLYEEGYKTIINIIETGGTPTDDFSFNLDKLSEASIAVNTGEQYDNTKGNHVIIDALFGIGLTRELAPKVKDVIQKINNTKNATIVSIDVPSGLFLDKKTEFAVQSDVVLTFQFTKLAFYLSGNKDFINDVGILNIGLDTAYIDATPANYIFIEKSEANNRYKPMHAHAHKGTQGHALIIGGSYGKIGAVCLSAKAALKSGCGLVTAYIPKCGYEIVQSTFPEAMVLTDHQEHIEDIDFQFEPKAIGIGPGIGQHPDTQRAIGDFLKTNKTSLVIDADALNILSHNKEWLTQLPENTILTPHPKELERLMGSWEDDFDKLEKMKAFSKKYRLILIGKDANTIIVHNDLVYINSTGNAGLATGGSGDVLTGIITGLLAQSYSPVDAAIFGVYLHGLSADIGARETSKQAFIASDILKYLGKAYLEIESGTPKK